MACVSACRICGEVCVPQPFVVWDDEYCIGVKTVDEQHKGLFALTNDPNVNDHQKEHDIFVKNVASENAIFA